jgi:asparagine N-glycosylation enzyme membrane subunit Stt3
MAATDRKVAFFVCLVAAAKIKISSATDWRLLDNGRLMYSKVSTYLQQGLATHC